MINTICWKNNGIEIIDQTALPFEEKYLHIQTTDELIQAIQKMKIRGAPALGIAGAYGIALGILELKNNGGNPEGIRKISEKISGSRPTAVNLKWGVERVMRAVLSGKETNNDNFFHTALAEAKSVHDEDIDCCRQIGMNGESLISDGSSVLTHCNTGGLATGGFGTALGIIETAHRNGKKIHVYVDETRPLMQGSRLTAWELQKAGIDHTLICDNMAGWLMQQNKISCVIVGADRIARNGDTANKIGTYSLAALAEKHRIPFYIAAPSSTIDPRTAHGDDITIENRSQKEITHVAGIPVAPEGTESYNPAFDVTPASLITAIITEKKIFYGPEYYFN